MELTVAVWAPVARDPIMKVLAADSALTVREANNEAGYLAALDGADVAILPGVTPCYTPAVAVAIKASDTVKWVHLISAGHEGPESTGWADKLFSHPGGAVSGAVAEHAIALLGALTRGISAAVTAQAQGQWHRDQARKSTTLDGGTLLVVGFGSIGRRVATIARGFGATVIGVSRSGAARPEADEIVTGDALADVIGEADFIISALPQTDATHHLFDAAMFARCKPGARFVNVGRGSSVDQVALREALESGQLGGAGLDVTDPEPLPAGDPLWTAPNIIITAHYAGAGDRRSGQKIAEGLTRNLSLFRARERLDYQIDV